MSTESDSRSQWLMDFCSLDWFWESSLGRWRKFFSLHLQSRKVRALSESRGAYVCVHAQSCLILCDHMGCSPPGSSVHGIFQARIQQKVAISSSRGSPQPRDWTHVSCIFYIHRIPPSHLSLGMGSTNEFPSQKFISIWLCPPIYLHSCLKK